MQSPRTVLLVQPAAAHAARLRPHLETAGYSLVEAADATMAMAMLNRSEIGLVVTDLYLPIGDERCLVRAIRRASQLRRTRILAYTAHGRRSDRSWALRAGAQGYVITRSGEERLLQVVDSLMRKGPRKAKPKSARTSPRKPRPAAPDIPAE